MKGGVGIVSCDVPPVKELLVELQEGAGAWMTYGWRRTECWPQGPDG